MNEKSRKVLVIGSGGREHAIIWALKRTATVPLELYCIPGNAGIAELATVEEIALTDHHALADFVKKHQIDLTFVGPEGPLAHGIVDAFQAAGLKITGPNRKAARLEASKVFAKEFMNRHGIPTARYRVASSQAEALEILGSGEFGGEASPVVLKADGLAAGKGVIVASSRSEAESAVNDLFSGKVVALEAANQVVIEEALRGTEASVLLFTDGKDYRIMPAARDHKRIGEKDAGPNTGGMGAITDKSVLDQATLQRIVAEVVEPTLSGAQLEGFQCRGILFVGLMLTTNGPKVLEYNVRFGDPETQAILVRLKSSLFEIFEAITEERLADVDVEWSDESSACVVLASGGYPGKHQSGFSISGLETGATGDDVQIFHAGTARSGTGEWSNSGGRVLGVTATGKDLETALAKCYRRISRINWTGMQFRRDIGKFRTAGSD